MQSSTAFFVLLCVAAPATSLPIPRHPRYAIHHVGQDAGLATLTVTALAQDGDGLIWIGTPSGLYRFDGAVAELFSEAEGLPGAYVEQLITAPDGRVFAVASRGIASFDGLRFVPLESPLFAQPAAGSLQAVAFDRSGRIYVATEAGLARVDGPDGADGRLFGAAAGIPRRVVAVAASRAGDVWIAMPGAIGKLVDDGVTPIALPPSLAPDDATALLADALGGLWIRTRHHVARLEPGASEARVVGEDVPSSNDFGIPALDRAGRLLVPTVAGLHLERDGRWISVGEDQGLASSAVTAVMEDRDAVLWLGLGGSGLDRWPNPDTFLGWTKAEGLPDNGVWALARDARKRLWIGTNDGIAVWDEAVGSFRVLREQDGLPAGRSGSLPSRRTEGSGRWRSRAVSAASIPKGWSRGRREPTVRSSLRPPASWPGSTAASGSKTVIASSPSAPHPTGRPPRRSLPFRPRPAARWARWP
ncbi:MAG: two-component regulator propeller domain-containing protein [Acidobacteriota bacterium]